jgi:putative ribosome biogenesis GTPase RsgA
MFESLEERRFREMKEIELMMEQARFKAALQKLNEQRSGQSSAGVSGAAGVGGGTLINKVSKDNTVNNYVVNGYVEDYFE